MSADGRVTGGAITNTSWQPSAAFWDDQGVAHDLTGFLTGNGIDVGGWDLYYVTGVSGQDGLYGFIGQGWHNNTIESFRVTGVAVAASPIPEPAHYAAMAGALGALGVILRRRRQTAAASRRA